MHLLLALVPAGEVHEALDLGCGTGRFSFALSDTYKCPVLAVDPSNAMLQEGRRTQGTGHHLAQGQRRRDSGRGRYRGSGVDVAGFSPH